MPVIREISANTTFAVRHPVLRAGKPFSSCHFEGDDLPSTKHFGLFLEDLLVGVISIFENRNRVLDEPQQIQVRGMAVLEIHRKKGFGEFLVQHVEKYLKSRKEFFVWFNARIIAVGFYEKLGYAKIGEPFEISDVGTHYVMFKKLKPDE